LKKKIKKKHLIILKIKKIIMLQKYYIIIICVLSLVFVASIVVSILFSPVKNTNNDICSPTNDDCSAKQSIVSKVSSFETTGKVEFNLDFTGSTKISSSVNYKSTRFDFGQNEIEVTNIKNTGFDWALESSATKFPTVSINSQELDEIEVFETLTWTVCKIDKGYGFLFPVLENQSYVWCVAENSYFQNPEFLQFMPFKMKYCKQIVKDVDNFPLIVYINSEENENKIYVNSANDEVGKLPWSQFSLITNVPPISYGGLVQDNTEPNLMVFVYVDSDFKLMIARSEDGFKTITDFVKVETMEDYAKTASNTITVLTNDKNELIIFISLLESGGQQNARQYSGNNLRATLFSKTEIGSNVGFLKNINVQWSFEVLNNQVFAYVSQNQRCIMVLPVVKESVVKQNVIVEQNSPNSFAKFAKVNENEIRMYIYSQLSEDDTFPAVSAYVSTKDNGLTWSIQTNVFPTSEPGSSSINVLDIDENSSMICSLCPRQVRKLNFEIQGTPTPVDKVDFSYSIYQEK
jgi:hypothetical protein